MRRKNMAVVLPLGNGFSSFVRAVSAVMVGAVVGLTAAYLLPLPAPIPVLTGLTMGVILGSPTRPRGLEEWLGRTVLSVGGAFLAGFLFFQDALFPAWSVAIATIAFAAGISAERWWHSVARWLVGVAILALILYLLSTLMALDPTFWGSDLLVELLCISAVLATSVWISTRLELRPVWGAGQRVASSPSVSQKPESQANEPLFTTERRALDEVARRIDGLVGELVDAAPAEAEFVEQIKKTLKETLLQADESIARWRTIRKTDSSGRIQELEQRIRANQERLSTTPDEAVRRALELTLQRQRLTLEQYQKMDAAQRAFGLRLQQVRSGLELLELSLERALTSSGAVSSDELDAIVDAMNEVHAAMDFDSEMELSLGDLPQELSGNGQSMVA